MDQAANIYRVAEDMVRHRGKDAYAFLCDNAEIAKFSGDIESAITWWDIALAALEVLNRQKSRLLALASAYLAGFEMLASSI